ncbi:frataxin-like iron-binding protein CyaY [Actinoalloteichus hoggarensis]|uniref:hypothetical protein n=1 Tax=Actinoalloteichus hoggarensis TaxID=1470176 RepID=UPI000B8AC772|nr:hypothetical protein [Actinoalloteichus hoggarensis]MBB5921606.1 frataxin-like iron-binding protein CyaY [Actinoalloteichus hoggarensis]
MVGHDYDHEIREPARLLALSAELAREVTEWDDESQAVFNRAAPQESVWPSPESGGCMAGEVQNPGSTHRA